MPEALEQVHRVHAAASQARLKGFRCKLTFAGPRIAFQMILSNYSFQREQRRGWQAICDKSEPKHPSLLEISMPHGPRFMKLCAEAKARVKEVTPEEARQK